jgi:uncharacterized membrane protein YqjE
MHDPDPQRGLFASLRRLLGTALEIAQVRIDLLATEVELEKRRFFDGLLWGAIAWLALDVGLVLLCGFVTLLFWEGYRLVAVGVMALAFLTLGVLLLREARARLRSPSGMFDASLAELESDRTGLEGASRDR